MPVDLGSVPDWLTVIGAFIALVFARAAARAAGDTNRQQAGQLRQLREEARLRGEANQQAQAGKVAFWVTLVRDENYLPAVRIVNSNPMPMYEATLYCATPMSTIIFTLNVVEPSNEPRIIQRFTERVRESLGDTAEHSLQIMDRNQMFVSGVFRDALNQWWYRAADGSLVYADSKSAAEERARRDISDASHSWNARAI